MNLSFSTYLLILFTRTILANPGHTENLEHREPHRRRKMRSWNDSNDHQFTRAPTPVPPPTILDQMTSLNLNNFTSALGQIYHKLDVCKWSSEYSYTVFGPSDAAFAGVDEDDLNITKLLTNPEWSDHLESLLNYHIVERRYALQTKNLSLGKMIRTVEGDVINVTSISPEITLNDYAKISTPDIEGCNGVLHVTDSILLPPSATDTIVDILSSIEKAETFLNYISLFSLNSTLEGDGPFTLFVPTNYAFRYADMESQTQEEQEYVIKYHISTDFGLGDTIKFLNKGYGSYLEVETFLGTNFVISKSSLRDHSSRSRRKLDGEDEVERSKVLINGEPIYLKEKILAKNGVIYLIDKLIRLESVFPTPSVAPSSIPSNIPRNIPSNTPSSTPSSIPSITPSLPSL